MADRERTATWGDDLLDVVEAGTEPGRFHRGEQLFLEGSVGAVEVRAGSFRAMVHGSRGDTYEAVLEVERITRADLPATIGAMVRDGLSGQEGRWRRSRADGGTLGPDEHVTLDTTCTCPDGEFEVCKHAIAMIHEVATLLDAHPRHWLTARGLPVGFGGIAGPTRSSRPPSVRVVAAPGEEPLADLTDDWFSPRATVPELPDGLRPRPVPFERDPDLLRDVLRPEFLGRGTAQVEHALDGAVGAVDAVYRALGCTPRALEGPDDPRAVGGAEPPAPVRRGRGG